MLHYQNDSLFERFLNIVPKCKSPILKVRIIIKWGIKNLKIKTTSQCIVQNIKSNLSIYNGFGENLVIKEYYTEKVDFRYYFIEHFFW